MSEQDQDPGEDASLKGLAARAVSAARASLAAQAAAAARISSVARNGFARRPDAEADDGRDEAIARLDAELAAERERSESLARTLKELEFKLEILERSYSKQLADARTRNDDTERELFELKDKLASTEDELAQVTAMRDRLRGMLSFDGRRTPTELREPRRPDDNTVNRLLSADDWSETESRDRDRYINDKVRGEEERPGGDLLAPELVFKADDEQ